MHLNESPFALTEHALTTEVGGHPLWVLGINALVLAGLVGATVWGFRKMYQGIVGKS